MSRSRSLEPRVTRSGATYGRAPTVNMGDRTPPGSDDEREEPRSARPPSLKNMVYLYSQQFDKGNAVRFTGSGSKASTRAQWERFTDALLVACLEHEELFALVEKILRDPITNDAPQGSVVLKRILYALLKTTTGSPASLVLSKPEFSSTMDGLGALRELRQKHEPIEKSAYRKALVMDVVLLQLDGEANPESLLMRWGKSIDHLKRAGCKTLDDLLKDLLVNALPTEYSHLITSWDEGGGVERVDQGDMIKSIITHYEHVIQPAKPAGRDRAMSAYNRYKEHTGGKPFDPRGRKPNHSNGKGSGRPPPQKGDGKDGGGPNNRGGGGPKKNGGLRNAQRKQKEKEAEEKAKNSTCSACGSKGHSQSSPLCPKNKAKAKESAQQAASGGDINSGYDDDLHMNQDGFYTIPAHGESRDARK